MRFHILDNGLIAEHGHHDHFARGFLKAAREQGCEVTIHGCKALASSLKAELGARPTFATPQYDAISEDPIDGPLTDFMVRSRALARDLKALDGQVAPEDVLLLPTASAALLAAVRVWRQTAPVNPRLAALFHRTDEPWGPGSLSMALLRTAFGGLRKEGPETFWCAATNPTLAGRLEPVLERPLVVSNSLTWYALPLDPDRRPVSGDEIRVGFIGTGRQEKGGGYIPTIVAAALRLPTPYRFIVQGHGAALTALYQDIEGHPRLDLHREWLDEESFAELVRSLDVVVLPYLRAAYRPMVSGVLAVAAGYGKPCIVPTKTWMSQQLDAGLAAGVRVDEPGWRAIVQALEELAADLPAHRRSAMEAAPRARAAFGIEAMVAELRGWASSGAPPSPLPDVLPAPAARPSPAPDPRRPRALICCYGPRSGAVFTEVLAQGHAALRLTTRMRMGLLEEIEPDVHMTLAIDPNLDGFQVQRWHRLVRMVEDPRQAWVSGYLWRRDGSDAWCVDDRGAVPPAETWRPEAWKRSFLQRLGRVSYRQNLLDRDLAQGLMFDLDGAAAATLQALGGWRRTGSHIMTVKLEALETEQTETLRRIFAHLDYSPRAQVLAVRAMSEVDAFTWARPPSWREVLTPELLQAFEARYGGLISALGYPTSAGPRASVA